MTRLIYGNVHNSSVVIRGNVLIPDLYLGRFLAKAESAMGIGAIARTLGADSDSIRLHRPGRSSLTRRIDFPSLGDHRYKT